MKSLIFSAVLFIILITVIVINSLYIHSVCNQASEILNSISPYDERGTEKLSSLWQKHRIVFGISIHNSQIDRMNELIEKLKSAVANGDGASVYEYKALISELLDDLRKNEEISLQSII